jgi:hypothetical protein
MWRLPNRVRIELERSDIALIAIVCVGVGLRLAYFTGLGFSDDPDYAARAFDLLAGRAHLYTDNNGLRIGTWYPAALGYAVFGITNVGLVIYPIVMSVLAITVMASLGTRLFDRRAGLIAALSLAFYPLDVELATRLLPDGLLAAWSLIAIGLLLSADLAQYEAPGAMNLLRPWSYFFSGAALGWCTVVNMSAIVLLAFLGLYLPVSALLLKRRSSPETFRRLFLAFCCRRYVILFIGFLAVALPEALLYRLKFGSFLTKYTGTLSHYNLEGRSFFRDLWFYPENMFFLHRGWKFQMPAAEYRPYGFFFLAAVPSTIYGLMKGGSRFFIVALWLVSVFAYLEWGSMSVTSWNFLHRLDRHLELITPPMILVIAFACARVADRRPGALVSTVALAWLFTTSLWTIHSRHADTMDHLSLMQPVHAVLEVFHPAHVFMDTQTGAYQRFLDRYEERGRSYHDITLLSSELTEDSMVIVHSDNTFSLQAGLNPLAPPPEWRLQATLNVPGRLGAPKTIRAYKVGPKIPEPIDVDRADLLELHLRGVDSTRVTRDTKLIFYWEGVVDGVEHVEIRGTAATLRHLAFQPARDVISRSYLPITLNQDWQYEVIKEIGRGDVTILEQPSPQNNFSLIVEVNDGRAPGAARYRWFIVGRLTR